jgi:integration host factor subunit beta
MLPKRRTLENRIPEWIMLKSHLVYQVHARNRHLTKQDVEHIVDALIERIAQALENNHRVEVRGFGIFTPRTRAPRTGRNPRTGQQVPVPERRVPHFKMAKELQYRLNMRAENIDESLSSQLPK